MIWQQVHNEYWLYVVQVVIYAHSVLWTVALLLLLVLLPAHRRAVKVVSFLACALVVLLLIRYGAATHAPFLAAVALCGPVYVLLKGIGWPLRQRDNHQGDNRRRTVRSGATRGRSSTAGLSSRAAWMLTPFSAVVSWVVEDYVRADPRCACWLDLARTARGEKSLRTRCERRELRSHAFEVPAWRRLLWGGVFWLVDGRIAVFEKLWSYWHLPINRLDLNEPQLLEAIEEEIKRSRSRLELAFMAESFEQYCEWAGTPGEPERKIREAGAHGRKWILLREARVEYLAFAGRLPERKDEPLRHQQESRELVGIAEYAYKTWQYRRQYDHLWYDDRTASEPASEAHEQEDAAVEADAAGQVTAPSNQAETDDVDVESTDVEVTDGDADTEEPPMFLPILGQLSHSVEEEDDEYDEDWEEEEFEDDDEAAYDATPGEAVDSEEAAEGQDVVGEDGPANDEWTGEEAIDAADNLGLPQETQTREGATKQPPAGEGSLDTEQQSAEEDEDLEGALNSPDLEDELFSHLEDETEESRDEADEDRLRPPRDVDRLHDLRKASTLLELSLGVPTTREFAEAERRIRPLRESSETVFASMMLLMLYCLRDDMHGVDVENLQAMAIGEWRAWLAARLARKGEFHRTFRQFSTMFVDRQICRESFASIRELFSTQRPANTRQWKLLADSQVQIAAQVRSEPALSNRLLCEAIGNYFRARQRGIWTPHYTESLIGTSTPSQTLLAFQKVGTQLSRGEANQLLWESPPVASPRPMPAPPTSTKRSRRGNRAAPSPRVSPPAAPPTPQAAAPPPPRMSPTQHATPPVSPPPETPPSAAPPPAKPPTRKKPPPLPSPSARELEVAGPPPVAASLVLRISNVKGRRRVRITEFPCLVGSDEGSRIQLSGIQGKHCEFNLEAGRVFVQTYGRAVVFVNEVQVSRAQLAAGNVIHIGAFTIEVEQS